MLGHLPFIFGRPIHDVCIIGLGTGVTAGAVTLYPVRQVEVIEIEPAVIEASALFEDVNHRPLTDPRVGVRVDDARNVLLVSPPSSYDLIVSQPSFPWASGSSKLFTLEFYRLARSRLRTPGIFAQWVQLYNMDFASVMTQLKTFSLVFPQTLAIQVGGSSGEILLLGLTPIPSDSATPVRIHCPYGNAGGAGGLRAVTGGAVGLDGGTANGFALIRAA